MTDISFSTMQIYYFKIMFYLKMYAGMQTMPRCEYEKARNV